ncbi:DoxX family protein [Pendulispora albinea]|uniref:DoxX family protein n=1 Tax=Pendulispora albinea TaxID=2741071 RepID=A0ABZ2LK51_9BACT
MSPHVLASEIDESGNRHPAARASSEGAQRYLVPLGRVLFSLIFLMAGPGHFSAQSIGYAAAAGVPLASVAVPLSGIIAAAGGLSIALGYKAKWGAWLIVLFLVPVTFMLHNFWAQPDPMQAQIHMAMFMKNLGLLGTALLIAHFGSGPFSLDARKR